MRGRISSNRARRCGSRNTDHSDFKARFTRICLVAYNPRRVMSRNTYRYYYYYGPLSTGRDGQAMGCRRSLTM